MSEHREEHLELCAAYAVGNIDPTDRHRLTEHLALGCSACESALGDYGAATMLLASSVPATPSDLLRQRVLAIAGIGVAVAEEPAPDMVIERAAPSAAPPQSVPHEREFAVAAEPRVARTPATAAASSTPRTAARAAPRTGARPSATGSTRGNAAAGGISSLAGLTRLRRSARATGMPPPLAMLSAGLGLLSLILLIVSLNLGGALGSAKREAAGNLDALTSINQRLADTQRWSDVMTAPSGRATTLVPIGDSGVMARARATFDPSTRSAVLVFDGLQAPPGRVFELWSLSPTGPTSLGLIQTDPYGRAIVQIEDAGDPNDLIGFAVSLEMPGSTRRRDPTRVVMLGRFEG